MQMGLDDAELDELRFLPFRVYATPNCEVCPFSLSNWDSKLTGTLKPIDPTEYPRDCLSSAVQEGLFY